MRKFSSFSFSLIIFILMNLKSDVLEDGFNLDFSLESNSVDLGEGPAFISPGKVPQSVEALSNIRCACFFALLVCNVNLSF